MAFSIWEYLRERARNATLAGIQDALDIAEEADFETSQKAAAGRLTARLSGQVVNKLPEPERATTEAPAPRAGGGSPEPEAASPTDGQVNSPAPVKGRSFGEGLEPTKPPAQAPVPAPDPFAERLNGPLPKAGTRPESATQERRGPSRNGHPAPDPEFDPPPKPETSQPRRRGRPRKDQG